MISPVSAPAFQPQRGAALVVALVLLLVMSLLAVTSLRGTLMQERMSANTYDRDLAFQSAEAGLRMGERQAENWVINGADTTVLANCNNPSTGGLYRNIAGDPGQCTQPLWEGPPPGEVNSFWRDASNDAGADNINFSDDGLSLAPYYIVELISLNAPCKIDEPDTNTNCNRFRVTASSRTTDGRSQVILQSIYAY